MKARFYLFFFVAIFFFGSCSSQKTVEKKTGSPYSHHKLSSYYDKNLAPFYHGVASGDPLQNAVILWTKLSPEFNDSINVRIEVALDKDFKKIIQTQTVITDEAHDYIVKKDIRDLKPSTFYYYRFFAMNKFSPVGRTKTLSDSNENVCLAFASCSNYAWGFFNAYRLMANDSLDAIVHLGDYIYEHSQDTYSNPQINRNHLPNKELVSLEDYRTRYAQYRLDKDLQAAHAAHPFIMIWDDHEFANNAYIDGAGNHQPDEGDWKTRLDAAKKAYYEWMPIREQENHQLYRSFSFGKMVKLIMLDTRVEGRTEQVKGKSDLMYNDTNRTIISTEQFKWVANEIVGDQKWNLVGNQVLFSNMLCFFGDKGNLYMDGWSGYPNQQKKFNELLSLVSQNRTAIVTGDFHNSFVYNNRLQASTQRSEIIKISDKYVPEIIVPSITSANYDEEFTIPQTEAFKKMYLKQNKDLEWAELNSHGYVVVKCTQAKMTASFRFCESILKSTGKKQPEVNFEWNAVDKMKLVK